MRVRWGFIAVLASALVYSSNARAQGCDEDCDTCFLRDSAWNARNDYTCVDRCKARKKRNCPPVPPESPSGSRILNQKSGGGGSSAATPKSNPKKLVPARAYLRAADIPPPSIGAYGVVALRSKPTPANRERLMRTCAAYVASLPRHNLLPTYVTPDDQMLTIWPLDNPDAIEALRDDCNFVIDHYDLFGGLSAIQDAQQQKAKFDGIGPFLIGWSPSNARGVSDKLVLVIDLSSFESQASLDEAFLIWQKKIVENPDLWMQGWAVDKIRLVLRDFADHYGSQVVRIFGGK